MVDLLQLDDLPVVDLLQLDDLPVVGRCHRVAQRGQIVPSCRLQDENVKSASKSIIIIISTSHYGDSSAVYRFSRQMVKLYFRYLAFVARGRHDTRSPSEDR